MPDSSEVERLFVRLYFDRHIMTQLAVDLRDRGFDVVTTEEAEKDTATDEEQLQFAANESRCILTFNIRDFAPLHQEWITAERSHPGILVSRQLGRRQYGVLLQRMERFLNNFSADEMRNNFVYLEQFK